MSISSNSWFGWTLLALAALHRYAFLSCSLSLIMFYTHIHVPIPSHVFLPFHLCRILLCACFVNVFSYEFHFFSLSWFSDNITLVWTRTNWQYLVTYIVEIVIQLQCTYMHLQYHQTSFPVSIMWKSFWPFLNINVFVFYFRFWTI